MVAGTGELGNWIRGGLLAGGLVGLIELILAWVVDDWVLYLGVVLVYDFSFW